jgi:hypothetical protein
MGVKLQEERLLVPVPVPVPMALEGRLPGQELVKLADRARVKVPHK